MYYAVVRQREDQADDGVALVTTSVFWDCEFRTTESDVNVLRRCRQLGAHPRQHVRAKLRNGTDCVSPFVLVVGIAHIE